METVRSAVKAAIKHSENIPLLAGGKSMGGRMTSQAAAENPPDNIKGIVFFGFPLHAPGKESNERAEHLLNVNIPMLFLQGTRDKLANLDLFKPIIKKLGNKAHLHILEGADHSFHVLKTSVKSDDDVLKEISKKVSDWTESIISIK